MAPDVHDRITPVQDFPPARPFPAMPEEITTGDILKFYELAHEEAERGGYSELHRSRLFHYKSGLGTMLSREEYFKQNYCCPLRLAVAEIFRRFSKPRILDVCCGTGTQAILFTLLGASVTALDYHDEQLDTMRQRLVFYSKKFGVDIPIDIIQADVTTLDFRGLGMFDAVYSHIGIGRLETADGIFRRLGGALRAGGLLVLKNGNPDCLWLKAVGRRPLDSTRREYLRCARAHGFEVMAARGTAGLPRPLWRFGPLSRAADQVFRQFVPLQLGIGYIFRKAA